MLPIGLSVARSRPKSAPRAEVAGLDSTLACRRQWRRAFEQGPLWESHPAGMPRDVRWTRRLTVSHRHGSRRASTRAQATGSPAFSRVQHACTVPPSASASRACSCLTPPKPDGIASRRNAWHSCYAAARRSWMMCVGRRSQPWQRPPPAPSEAGLGPLAAAWTAPRRASRRWSGSRLGTSEALTEMSAVVMRSTLPAGATSESVAEARYTWVGRARSEDRNSGFLAATKEIGPPCECGM